MINDTNTCIIGIDWADVEHVFHVIDETGNEQTGILPQSPEHIRQTIEGWRKEHPKATFAVAIEASKGPLINSLAEFEDVESFPSTQRRWPAIEKRSLTAAARMILQMRTSSISICSTIANDSGR